MGVPGEGQLLVSVVGAFEHDAGVVRTATTVGQFAGTSGSILGLVGQLLGTCGSILGAVGSDCGAGSFFSVLF